MKQPPWVMSQVTTIKTVGLISKLSLTPLHFAPVTQLGAIESENDKDDSSFEISVKIGDTSSSPQRPLFSSKRTHT